MLRPKYRLQLSFLREEYQELEVWRKIQAVYQKAGDPSRADLRYYDTPHEFNRQMQQDALAWLKKWLS